MIEAAKQTEEIALRDAQANNYDDIWFKTRGEFSITAQFRSILSYIAPHPGEEILDAGCGTGYYSVELAARGAHVFAVDFSAKSVDIVRRKAAARNITGIETAVGDLATVELPRERFDTAISIEVLQHIPTHEKRVQALRNIRCALRYGGRFLMVVYRYGGWIKPPAPKEELNHAGNGLYRFAFTAQDGATLFRDAGFRLREVHGILNLPRRMRKHLPLWVTPVERIISALPFSRDIGDYLLFEGTKE